MAIPDGEQGTFEIGGVTPSDESSSSPEEQPGRVGRGYSNEIPDSGDVPIPQDGTDKTLDSSPDERSSSSDEAVPNEPEQPGRVGRGFPDQNLNFKLNASPDSAHRHRSGAVSPESRQVSNDSEKSLGTSGRIISPTPPSGDADSDDAGVVLENSPEHSSGESPERDDDEGNPGGFGGGEEVEQRDEQEVDDGDKENNPERGEDIEFEPVDAVGAMRYGDNVVNEEVQENEEVPRNGEERNDEQALNDRDIPQDREVPRDGRDRNDEHAQNDKDIPRDGEDSDESEASQEPVERVDPVEDLPGEIPNQGNLDGSEDEEEVEDAQSSPANPLKRPRGDEDNDEGGAAKRQNIV